jgi:D-alanyl-D-alanine carboxypeptidase
LIDVRTEQALIAALDSAVAQAGALGATAAVRCDGLGAWSGASGFVDLERTVRIQPDACLPIYSITKSITAVCTLRLAEIGALTLEDPIARWVPDLPLRESVSLRKLLNHSAGVPNYSLIEEQIRALASSPRQAWSFDEFVDVCCRRRDLDFEPGAGWQYSNTGFMLLKRVVERANQSSYADAVVQHVSGPMGFTSTLCVEDSLADLGPGFSRRFSADREPADVRGAYDPGWCATGLVASTAAEVCAFYFALFGGKLVTLDSLRQMTELLRVPGDFPPAVSPGYGLGLMGDPDGPLGPEYGHGGAGPGFDIRASCWPRLKGRRVAMAVFCNTDEVESAAILAQLSGAFAEQLGDTLTLS